jgi:putative nucleotidyltransferase with HDIG domain
MCAAAALFLWAFTQSWDPPFRHREGEIPKRNIVARVDFQVPDQAGTQEARQRARKLAIGIYDQDPKPIEQLRAQLRSEIGKLLAAQTLDEVEPSVWASFQPPAAPATPDPTPAERQAQFDRLREAISGENALDKLSETLAEAMGPLEQWGILAPLPTDYSANFERIEIRSPKSEGFGVQKEVASVLLEAQAAQLQQTLTERIPSLELAQRVFAWIRPRLAPTLSLNVDATRLAQDKAAALVQPVTVLYERGQNVLAVAGVPLKAEGLNLLRREYEAEMKARTLAQRAQRSLAVIGMYVAIYTLCGFYIYFRDRWILGDLLHLTNLLALAVLTVAVAHVVSGYSWEADVIPLLLCGMIVAIAYHQELALLYSACVTLLVVLSIGHDFSEMLILLATSAGAILTLRQVRTRSKLLTVGFTAAVVGCLTTFGVGSLHGEAWGRLLTDGAVIALWSVIAGSLMTVLLPTVEKVFGVQTDLSLIELGDPAHPLLQELIRRAPGTYNHSITVASLAEAAAESIGARGLLVRVGAYFHDIGKMLKPGYFVENQARGENRHDTLVPAMSTLVIIAHVKDGADLARQNKLPEAIIDFIQQHHGTTLVEYFYRQASEKKRREDPAAAKIDESSFRYPGPKPQSREAGVLMLSDAVESASRVLKEPTPSRIESLVEDISMKRLLDGQFDESGLTLEEVRKIGESLVKSLTAVYHGRVKYPDQETA